MSEKKYLVHADVDWIQGHLRFGHFEGEFTEEQYQEYINLPSEEKKEYIRDVCNLIVDDWSIESYDDPSNIEITQIK